MAPVELPTCDDCRRTDAPVRRYRVLWVDGGEDCEPWDLCSYCAGEAAYNPNIERIEVMAAERIG